MTPATAFAPGSPAAGGGIASGAMTAALGAGGISVPGLTSSSSSGDIGQTFGTDNSGFNVNFGTSFGQGGAAAIVPWWVWAGALVGGLLWIKRKST
jgi:hypothetical protein